MLTKNQEKFIEEIIKGSSQRAAYRAAYPSCKASDKTVDVKASNLFSRDKVRIRYQELFKASIDKTADDATTMRAFIIGELKKMARADLKDFYQMTAEGIVGIKDLREADTSVIQEIGFSKDGPPKIKLYDKQKALDKLAELYGITGDLQAEKPSITLEDMAEDYLV